MAVIDVMKGRSITIPESLHQRALLQLHTIHMDIKKKDYWHEDLYIGSTPMILKIPLKVLDMFSISGHTTEGQTNTI